MVKAGIITGRIFEIVNVAENVIKIILKKKDVQGKMSCVAITAVGYWKDKALKEVNVRDKIKANIYIKSKLYNGKWYSDVHFREIYVIELAPVKMKRDKESGMLFNTDGGEVFDIKK